MLKTKRSAFRHVSRYCSVTSHTDDKALLWRQWWYSINYKITITIITNTFPTGQRRLRSPGLLCRVTTFTNICTYVIYTRLSLFSIMKLSFRHVVRASVAWCLWRVPLIAGPESANTDTGRVKVWSITIQGVWCANSKLHPLSLSAL